MAFVSEKTSWYLLTVRLLVEELISCSMLIRQHEHLHKNVLRFLIQRQHNIALRLATSAPYQVNFNYGYNYCRMRSVIKVSNY